MTDDHVREPVEDLRVARGDSEEEVWAKLRDRRAQARAEAACDWVYHDRGSHRDRGPAGPGEVVRTGT